MNTYTVGSLFAGIGGIDLAFEWAGYETKWQVEIEDFPRRVLDKHWPGLLRPRDVRGCTGRSGKGWRRYQRLPRVDCLVGGFPCQPHSVAGNRLGAADSRNLWPDFRRLIGDLRPRAVLLENVPGILTTMGAGVIADLAALGYVGRTGIISAADAGAFHLRERWFAVAYDSRQRIQGNQQGPLCGKSGVSWGKNGGGAAIFPRRSDIHSPRLCRSLYGIPDGVDRVKAIGNSAAPPVIYPLAVAIREWLQAQDANESADQSVIAA